MAPGVTAGTFVSPLVIPLDPAPLPAAVLSRLAGWPLPALLEGAADQHDLGRFSYLSADPVALLEANADEWPMVRDSLRATFDHAHPADTSLPPFQGGWIGWFGYELGRAFDRMPRALRDDLQLPELSLALHDWVIAWDHLAGKAWLISTGINRQGVRDTVQAVRRARMVLDALEGPRAPFTWRPEPAGEVLTESWGEPVDSSALDLMPEGLRASFAADGYRTAVGGIVRKILAGEIFQANLSQRFTAPFHGDPFALRAAILRRSAAPLSAYLTRPHARVISASPERFLRYDARTRIVETRPIKGTRPRDVDPVRGDALARELDASEKDRAENVMIVDLLRNDLSRTCVPGTVRATSLCRLEHHPTVFHLVSTIEGTLREDRDALDLLATTFPGGSITGAPKLRAMAILAELEPVVRGVYCGAIGWLGLDGGMDTSIAIRTVVLARGLAAVHAGGGVTALSDPDAEYLETLDKARALVASLAECA